MKRAVTRTLATGRDLVVLTTAIYLEIAVSALGLFRGLMPQPDPWLRGLPREARPLKALAD